MTLAAGADTDGDLDVDCHRDAGSGHRVARRPARRAGRVVVICHLGGTLGSPKLMDWVTKDI
ncbi:MULTISPECIES: hypothetical protein [Microbacteriaceae]|uniref:hypothetical protein n=1 Tax=Microbacteriaceae TaxID=85023 RepID=UPI00037D45FF|nr:MULTISPECIES: hypothetical protein [Microbacteriaceae]TDQ03004.1 hypothetical protein AXZ95_1284 [Leifsonia sp. 115AMFTsu3.1]